jgi:hypothetical protein
MLKFVLSGPSICWAAGVTLVLAVSGAAHAKTRRP